MLRVKSRNWQLLHLHLTYPTCICCLHWGWSRLSYADTFCNWKTESLGYRVVLFTWSYVELFQQNTDLWQMDTRLQLIPALSSDARVKKIIVNYTQRLSYAKDRGRESGAFKGWLNRQCVASWWKLRNHWLNPPFFIHSRTLEGRDVSSPMPPRHKIKVNLG